MVSECVCVCDMFSACVCVCDHLQRLFLGTLVDLLHHWRKSRYDHELLSGRMLNSKNPSVYSSSLSFTKSLFLKLI